MALGFDEFSKYLEDQEASAARVAVCETMARCLDASGRVLWAFGLVTGPRRPVATAIQLAAATSAGTVSLLRAENPYAAAALVRQLVEQEYLLCLFALYPDEPLVWMTAGADTLQREYMPAKMRARCGDRFRSEEYAVHCGVGGHPRYQASFLLPERMFGDTHPWGTQNWLWLDLAQHLEAIWSSVGSCLKQYSLLDVAIAAQSLDDVRGAIANWRARDPCAAGLSEVEVKLRQLGADESEKH
jgi:hypothetical protein